MAVRWAVAGYVSNCTIIVALLYLMYYQFAGDARLVFTITIAMCLICRAQNIPSSERSLEPPSAGSSAARKVPGPALGQLFPTRAPASFSLSPYHHPQATTMPDPRPTLSSSWKCRRCYRASTEHHLKPKPSQLTIHYAPSPGEAPARVRCPSHQLSVSLCLDSSRLWLDRE